MFYLPIEKIKNTNRYKRVVEILNVKLLLKVDKDFLVSQDLLNAPIEVIIDFIDCSLEETPTDDINKSLIVEV